MRAGMVITVQIRSYVNGCEIPVETRRTTRRTLSSSGMVREQRRSCRFFRAGSNALCGEAKQYRPYLDMRELDDFCFRKNLTNRAHEPYACN